MSVSPRTETIMLTASIVAGMVLSCVGTFFSMLSYSPTFFALPLALALMWLGHLRPIGALYVALAVAVAFFAAVFASILVHSAVNASLCLYCTAAETRANIPKEQIVGGVGGFVGGAVAFAAITPLGRDVRDRRTLFTMLAACAILAVLGSIAFSDALPGTTTRLLTATDAASKFLQTLFFVVPWQAVFGATLAIVLRRHTPKQFAPATA